MEKIGDARPSGNLGLFGFELALFFRPPKSENISYYFIIKELTLTWLF